MDQSTPDPRDRVVLQDVLHAIRNVRFSYVQVIVHEGKAIQIDTMEKKRLDRLPR